MSGTGTTVGNVADFLDDLIGGGPGTDLAEAGPACARIADDLDDSRDASGVIATVLWSLISRSRSFTGLMHEVTLSSADPSGTFVIAHPLFAPQPRFDLLVLHSAMAGQPPAVRRVQPPVAEPHSLEALHELPKQLAHPTSFWLEAAQEVFGVQEPAVVFAEPPAELDTAGLACLAPDPSLDVRAERGSPRSTSIGVVVRCADDEVGLTTALHGLGNPSASEAWIADQRAKVAAAHAISDSAILKLDDAHSLDLLNGDRIVGPLSGRTPRQGDPPAHFNGATSRRQRTYVTGWSPDLLMVTPWNQVKVLTTPESVPGDSGAALVDEEGYVLGFAHAVSDFSTPMPFSTWIWADSVFRAHNLKGYDVAVV
jgi:S1-C subfamily serine protease